MCRNLGCFPKNPDTYPMSAPRAIHLVHWWLWMIVLLCNGGVHYMDLDTRMVLSHAVRSQGITTAWGVHTLIRTILPAGGLSWFLDFSSMEG